MEDEEVVCPLCLNEMDDTDCRFYPCPCGYQVCVWCYHHINEKLDKRCPACRRPYDPSNVRLSETDEARLSSRNASDRKKRTGAVLSGSISQFPSTASVAAAAASGKGSSKPSGYVSSGSYVQGGSRPGVLPARQHLENVRVLQRNLVYIVGIPLEQSDEEILRSHEYFGQYGPIRKLIVNRATSYQHQGKTTVSAYITYETEQAAFIAISCTNGAYLDGRQLKSSYGTSKYCSRFLKGIDCPNPDCMYLHAFGRGEDTFTKEDMLEDKRNFLGCVNPDVLPAAEQYVGPGLPPPSFVLGSASESLINAALGNLDDSISKSNGVSLDPSEWPSVSQRPNRGVSQADSTLNAAQGMRPSNSGDLQNPLWKSISYQQFPYGGSRLRPSFLDEVLHTFGSENVDPEMMRKMTVPGECLSVSDLFPFGCLYRFTVSSSLLQYINGESRSAFHPVHGDSTGRHLLADPAIARIETNNGPSLAAAAAAAAAVHGRSGGQSYARQAILERQQQTQAAISALLTKR